MGKAGRRDASEAAEPQKGAVDGDGSSHGDAAVGGETKGASGPYSVGVAFLRLMLGGFFGLHHFYLNRTFQAVLWAFTFGGFGFGLVYDFFFLTRYVEIANTIAKTKKLYPKQSVILRFIGMVVFGSFMRNLFYNAVPFAFMEEIELKELIAGLFGAVGCVWCITAIGNYSYTSGLSWGALVTAFTVELLIFSRDCRGDDDNEGIFQTLNCNGETEQDLSVAFYTTCAFFIDRRFKISERLFGTKTNAYHPPKSYARRSCDYFCLWLVFFSLYLAMFLFNVDMDELDDNGEKTGKKTTAFALLVAYFQSDDWHSIRDHLWETYEYCREHTEECWELFAEKFESPQSKLNSAFGVLGVSNEASLKEVKQAHRALAKQFHPDRCHEDWCADKFMEIEEAYQHILSCLK